MPLYVRPPHYWYQQSTLAYLLWPLSMVYYAVTKLRQWLTSKPYQSRIPILCVGNITIGGSGKTPTVLALVKLCKQMGLEVACLSRGYGGSLNQATIVDRAQHHASEVGDEPLIIAKACNMMVVAKNRQEGVALIEQAKTKYDVIIMDDGLQNPTIKKQLSLCVVDHRYQKGNGLMLPAGPLRQPWKAIQQYDAVIYVGGKDNQNILNHSQIFHASIVPYPTPLPNRVVAFSGIAHPDKFFTTLEKKNIDIVKKISFADHYPYTNNDIASMVTLAEQHEARLITTRKDFVRIPAQYQGYVDVCDVTLQWQNEELLRTWLTEKLA